MPIPRLLVLSLALLAAAPACFAEEAVDLARRALEERKPDEARRLVEAPAQAGDLEALLLLGRAELESGRADEALAAFEKLRKKQPGTARHHWWYGRACQLKVDEVAKLLQLRWAKRMRKAFERAVELEPDNPDFVYALMRFHREAPDIAGGDRELAYRHAEELAKLDPALGEPNLAAMLQEDERYAEAAAAFERALGANPDAKGLRYGWSLSLADAGQGAESFAVLEPLLQGDEPDAIALYCVGRNAAVTRTGLEPGREALTRFLASERGESSPTHADAHWRLGNLSEHAGDLEAARGSYRKALELDPKHDRARESLGRLD